VNFSHAALYHGDIFWEGGVTGPMKRRIFIALALLPNLAFAHSSKLGNIAIGHSWALPSTNAEVQVMMPILNLGTKEDVLIAATTPIALGVELRGSDFVLLPNKPFAMRASASHLKVIGLSKPLVRGDVFSLTLKFKNAGEIEIQIHVSDRPGD
jgi:periplasmic copper chaperone A